MNIDATKVQVAAVTMPRLPTEIWEIIFQKVRRAEEKPRSSHLRICKAIYMPAFAALYSEYKVKFVLDEETGKIGLFRRMSSETVANHSHRVQRMIISPKGYPEDVDGIGGQLEPYDAGRVAKRFSRMLPLFSKLTFLSIDFRGLFEMPEHKISLLLVQAASLQNLRTMELRSPQAAWIAMLLSILRGKHLSQIILHSPTAYPRVLSTYPAALGSVQSLTIAMPGFNMMPPHVMEGFENMFKVLSASARLEHLHFEDRDYDFPFTGKQLLSVFIRHGASLKYLHMGLAIDDHDWRDELNHDTRKYEERNSLAGLQLSALVNLTDLTLTTCSWFFDLDSSELPPMLRHFTAKTHKGPIDAVLAKLADNRWLPNLQTFDLTICPRHLNIEKMPTETGEDYYDVWVDKDRNLLLYSATESLTEYIAKNGRPLRDFAQRAMDICKSRDIHHQFPEKFFKCACFHENFESSRKL